MSFSFSKALEEEIGYVDISGEYTLDHLRAIQDNNYLSRFLLKKMADLVDPCAEMSDSLEKAAVVYEGKRLLMDKGAMPFFLAIKRHSNFYSQLTDIFSVHPHEGVHFVYERFGVTKRRAICYTKEQLAPLIKECSKGYKNPFWKSEEEKDKNQDASYKMVFYKISTSFEISNLKLIENSDNHNILEKIANIIIGKGRLHPNYRDTLLFHPNSHDTLLTAIHKAGKSGYEYYEDDEDMLQIIVAIERKKLSNGHYAKIQPNDILSVHPDPLHEASLRQTNTLDYVKTLDPKLKEKFDKTQAEFYRGYQNPHHDFLKRQRESKDLSKEDPKTPWCLLFPKPKIIAPTRKPAMQSRLPKWHP